MYRLMDALAPLDAGLPSLMPTLIASTPHTCTYQDLTAVERYHKFHSYVAQPPVDTLVLYATCIPKGARCVVGTG